MVAATYRHLLQFSLLAGTHDGYQVVSLYRMEAVSP